MEERKSKHLYICSNPSQFDVEGNAPGFEGIHIIHNALPEIGESEVNTKVDFLGTEAALPLFISCMTGGSEGGFMANKSLATAAQQAGIPVGLGSIRVLFDHPELIEHFHIKPQAPDVPVLANIGSVQVRDRNHKDLIELCKRLEVQSLVVHLNPGQEMFQPEGDRDYRNQMAAIAALCDLSPIPIIVKETGFGIHPTLISRFLDAGAAYVDVAGAGGTNWIAVESYRMPEEEREAAGEFDSWGMPTSILMASLKEIGLTETGKILASGGLRSGMDISKALILGAALTGLALPFIREVTDGGEEAVLKYIGRLKKVLRTVMVLTGSKNLSELRNRKVWLEHHFYQNLRSFQTTVDQNLFMSPWANEEAQP